MVVQLDFTEYDYYTFNDDNRSLAIFLKLTTPKLVSWALRWNKHIFSLPKIR